MKPFSFLFLVLFLLPSTARSAPLERDLGQGLAYCRVHRLPADLPGTAPKQTRALVLDLRYTASNNAGAAALDAWLKFRAGPSSPVLLLVNGATAPTLAAMLATRDSAAGLLVLGSASGACTPDITLDIAPADERAAYDALEHGTALEALLSDTPEKPRHDEAELVRQNRGMTPAAVAEDPPPVTEPKTPATPPLTDRTLQRAVHVHRALLALRKLPPG